MGTVRAIRKRPESAIEVLQDTIQEYLYLPDPSVLYLLLGAVAANCIEGCPVWMMLVGPPGDGKTELLNSLLGLEGMHEQMNITNDSAFLSATSEKDRADDCTGGILRKVNKHGCIILPDFTSVLSKNERDRDSIMDVFRQSYGGYYIRNTGSEGGRQLRWDGKLALVGGCTGEIDNRLSTHAALGERWIYCRTDDLNADQRVAMHAKSKAAIRNRSRNGWQDRVRLAVRMFFDSLDLQFGGAAETLRPAPEVDSMVIDRLIRMAHLAVICRSSVVRDGYTKEIAGARETESPNRLVTVLSQLYVALKLLGLADSVIWRLIAKVCFDSMPRLRQLVMKLIDSQGSATKQQLGEYIGCSHSTAERAAEDLKFHGALVHVKPPGENRGRYMLSDWFAGDWKQLISRG